MQDLFFYDFDFNRLSEFRKCISVNWTINYCGYGRFEAHFPITDSKLLDILDRNKYLICVQGDNQAVISGWRIDEDIAVFGKTAEWLMTKRGINAFKYEKAYPTTIANYVVSDAMGDFVDVKEDLSLGTQEEYSTSEVRTVYDLVCELLQKDNLGFKLRANIQSKKFKFEIYSGEENRIILSQANKSSHSMTYTKELQDMATNSGWYKRKLEDMGTWNAVNNIPPLSQKAENNAYKYYKITSDDYTQFNLECKKGSYIYSDTKDGTWKISETRPDAVWVHIDNANVSGAKKWDCIINGEKTKDEGLSQIRKKTVSETIDAEMRRIKYGTDYKLGDTVRVQFEAGSFKSTLRKRVIGVQIFYDVDKMGIRPVLSD